jgi:hypothetical protein
VNRQASIPAPTGREIQVVRNNLSAELAERILAFWERTTGLSGEDARKRLGQVVCVLLDADGAIAGANSVYEDTVDLLGGRRFKVYRSYLVPEAMDDWEAMLGVAFDELDRDYDPQGSGPGGMCVPIGDPAEIAKRPDALWPMTMMTYAGRLPDGTHLRVRYFVEGKI